jgi:hypothetical protein
VGVLMRVVGKGRSRWGRWGVGGAVDTGGCAVTWAEEEWMVGAVPGGVSRFGWGGEYGGEDFGELESGVAGGCWLDRFKSEVPLFPHNAMDPWIGQARGESSGTCGGSLALSGSFLRGPRSMIGSNGTVHGREEERAASQGGGVALPARKPLHLPTMEACRERLNSWNCTSVPVPGGRSAGPAPPVARSSPTKSAIDRRTQQFTLRGPCPDSVPRTTGGKPVGVVSSATALPLLPSGDPDFTCPLEGSSPRQSHRNRSLSKVCLTHGANDFIRS